MKKKFFIFIFSLAVLLFINANASLAYKFTDIGSLYQQTAGQAGLKTSETAPIIAGVINIFLGLAGAIFVILFIYGGIEWLTSAGNQEKIGKAKKVLIYAVIGLVIVSGGYTIAFFIGNALQATTGGTTTAGTPPETCNSAGAKLTSGGSNVIGVCKTIYACAHDIPAGDTSLGTMDCAPNICCLITQ